MTRNKGLLNLQSGICGILLFYFLMCWGPVSGMSKPLEKSINSKYMQQNKQANPSESLKWKYDIGYQIIGLANDSKGRVYVTTTDTLYAIDANGGLRWKYGIGEHDQALSKPTVVGDSLIYWQSYNLTSLHENGSVRWKMQGGFDNSISPIVDSSGTIFTCMGGVAAIQPDTSVTWQIEDIHCSTSLTLSEDNIYVGTKTGSLYSITQNGKVTWKNSIDAGSDDTSATTLNTVFFDATKPIIDRDGIIYVGGGGTDWHSLPDVYMCAFKPNGDLKWAYLTDAFTGDDLLDPVLGKNGKLHTAIDSRYIISLTKEGDSAWTYKAEINSPASKDSSGNIYVGVYPGEIHSLNNEGKLMKVISTNNSRAIGRPIIYDNKTLFAKINQTVYAFSLKTFVDVEKVAPIASNFHLKHNYPNPFNPTTNIRFSLPQSEQITINVYNTIGQKIETLVNRQMTAGSHSVTFNAEGLPSGVYIYRLKTGGVSESRKMLLVK